MVEPISLVLISGAASIGMALGRLTRKEPESLDPLPPAFEFNSPREPIEPANLQFFSVEDVVNPVEIIDIAKAGAEVFISIKKLMSKADKLLRFINKLNQAVEVHELQLHQISKDLLLVNKRDKDIQVHTLKRMTNDNPDLDDLLIHKSIAGY